MSEPRDLKNDNLEETVRIMGRMVKTPPQPHDSGKPVKSQDAKGKPGIKRASGASANAKRRAPSA